MQHPAEDKWAERRSSTRVLLKTSVTLVSESNFYTGFSNNISEGGIFVATYEPMALGTQLELEFCLGADDNPIKAVGVVRWVREYNPHSDAPPGIGLQFAELSAADRQRVEAFVRQRETLFYDD